MHVFEQKHVHAFYEDSSKEFSATRFKTWPKVEYFYQKYVKDTDVVVDAGSGNGRNTFFPERTLSLDYSHGLLSIARERQSGAFYGRVDLADAFPVRASSCDVAISIAVIHHLSTEERRLAAVRHMVEVVKPGGYLLVYVWSDTPEGAPAKFVSLQAIEDTSITETMPKVVANDVFVGWKKQNMLNRYYHLFQEGELENLVSTCNVDIMEQGKDHGNYFIVCQKQY
ncbi:alkylated DNA repair protein alkB -like 8 [Nematocida displodere]|uniref:Alkylated DNA repair protein alkB-like 8 n=1 Tax=Nematocida displodere TaxID=1805483 RepID=A0A177EBG4_9MICR|nr:alkylated DNA repair protein alkB -like 8 [Nematocida displodere]